MASVLGITVSADLLARWREWFAPQLQPFRVDQPGVADAGLGRSAEPTLDVRDTFHVYDDARWTWLAETEFVELGLRTRRALVRGRAATGRMRDLTVGDRDLVGGERTDSRIVWWPPLLRRVGDRPLLDYVEHGLPPSRHRAVTPAIWARAERVLPGAVDLAGRFPASSGPNCFGNVLAAAGVGGSSDWVQREPFENWLAARTVPVRGAGRDRLPGVVLVWRDGDGLAEHAAVTLGDGYVLNKPSQGWFSPRLVWTVPETVAASRYRGVTLHRYLIS